MKKSHLFFTAAITWFIISLVLFTLPGTAFPQENWLDRIYFDKWVHIGLFLVMVVLWCLSISSLNGSKDPVRLKRSFLLVAVAGVLYGIAIEFIQKYFIPFRSFDYTDMIADGVGCAAGWLFSTRRYIKK